LFDKENLIKPCIPLHVAYEVGAARQQTVRSPRTMYPHVQKWHRNREARSADSLDRRGMFHRLPPFRPPFQPPLICRVSIAMLSTLT